MPTRFLHDCRRTAARNLILASVPERVAMLLTGHKSRAIFARNVAFANRQWARAGGDPLAEKRHGQGAPTVEEAAAAVWEQQRPGWRNAKHVRDWPRSLRAYAFPRIGAMPVSEVTTANVLAILTPIWPDKPETARRVRQRIGAVMKWAVAMGYRPDNPAGDALGQALGRQQAVVQHMRALPHGAVADALATVASLPGLGHHQGCVRVPGAARRCSGRLYRLH